MAVLLRHKNMIFGLNDDISRLDLADSNEALARSNADQALQNSIDGEILRATTAEGTLTSNLAQEVLDRIAGDGALDSRLDIIEAGLMSGIFWRQSFETLAELETALATNEATSEAGWAYYVKSENDGYVIVDENDGDYVPTGWTTKSLIKFADYTELSGLVSAEKTRAELAEATKLTKSDNLSDLTDVAAARTNLKVYSKTETASLISQGGAEGIMEVLTVIDNKIVLSHAPKNGLILNFATVRHTDANLVSWDIPVIKDNTDVTGKTFTLSPDTTGQFDSKIVSVQYFYIAS